MTESSDVTEIEGRPVGLSIVVPVYRGAATVGALVEALSALRPAGGLEIVLVNDGSPDNSGEVCRVLARTATVPLTYIEHARNFGEHNAVMTGLRHARGAYVITMDDDLQNPPEEVVKLYDHARLGGWDVVYTRYAVKEHEGWRNIGSRFANRGRGPAARQAEGPLPLVLPLHERDGGAGGHQVPRPLPLCGRAADAGDAAPRQHRGEAPAARRGRSNYTLKRLVLLWLNLATNFSVLPLRMAILAGVAMGIFGLMGAVLVTIEALMGETPSGWASTMTIMLLIAGVQFLILGVLGEYVGRAFLSANGKPQGVVREVIPAQPAAAEAEGAAEPPRMRAVS
jgi:undecaprenyl-phosphate 4-deoxy-4-formamido-L-arabinose transferase